MLEGIPIIQVFEIILICCRKIKNNIDMLECLIFTTNICFDHCFPGKLLMY